MSKNNWNLIKQSKGFYINTYRKTSHVLLFSVFLNLIFVFSIYYVYFNQSENDFYATSGITSPIKLTALESRNNTSTALLANDPENELENKVIPQ